MLIKPNKDLNRFIQICLDVADYYDNMMELEDPPDRFTGDKLLDSIGLGYRAFTNYLRCGVKNLLNLKSIYYEARERENYFEQACKEKEKFMMDIFGEENVEELTPELKAKIKNFVQTLLEDDEGEEE